MYVHQQKRVDLSVLNLQNNLEIYLNVTVQYATHFCPCKLQ